MNITHTCTLTFMPSARTVKCQCMEIQTVREVVSHGKSSALLRRELHYLSDTDRQALLNEAGVVSRIGAQEALAIMAGIGMPWAKLRLLRRCSGLCACDKKLLTICADG